MQHNNYMRDNDVNMRPKLCCIVNMILDGLSPCDVDMNKSHVNIIMSKTLPSEANQRKEKEANPNCMTL